MAIAFDVLICLHVFEHPIRDRLVALPHLIERIAVAVLDRVGHEGGTATDLIVWVFENQVTINQ